MAITKITAVDRTATPVSSQILTGIEATEEVLKASAGNVKALDLDNTSVAAVTYFKLYDDAAAVHGTTVPDIEVAVPASTRLVLHITTGYACTSGIVVAAADASGTGGSAVANFDATVVHT